MSLSNLVKTFWSGGNLETYMNAIEAEAAQVPGATQPLANAHIRTQAMPDKPGKMTFSTRIACISDKSFSKIDPSKSGKPA